MHILKHLFVWDKDIGFSFNSIDYYDYDDDDQLFLWYGWPTKHV